MIETQIAFEQRSDAAAAALLESQLETIADNFEAALDGRDPEALHDLRVAVRRSRTIQRECKGVFPPEQLAHIRAEFRWLQRATGPARDLDVYVCGFDELRALVPIGARDDLEPLLELLSERRQRARLEMKRALRSERATTLLSDWQALLEDLEALSEGDRADAHRPVGELSGVRIRKLYRRMVRMGRHIGPESSPEDFHELRKQGKELRYMLELFGSPLYPEEVVRPMIKALKSLQDMLGRHQDRHVQVALLRELKTELAAREDGAAAGSAVSALIAVLRRDEKKARGEFGERFARFASPEERAVVKQTFSYR
ncbi:MAG: CHAD domain-containing protein [Solirubrobacterales bacterium]|nr:CHAD domain-containing protein [Solirubrobacterales bacterium]MBV9165576.1 CHAD domain-containing protein [Solirubrobacterales bacterium]